MGISLRLVEKELQLAQEYCLARPKPDSEIKCGLGPCKTSYYWGETLRATIGLSRRARNSTLRAAMIETDDPEHGDRSPGARGDRLDASFDIRSDDGCRRRGPENPGAVRVPPIRLALSAANRLWKDLRTCRSWLAAPGRGRDPARRCAVGFACGEPPAFAWRWISPPPRQRRPAYVVVRSRPGAVAVSGWNCAPTIGPGRASSATSCCRRMSRSG